MKHLLEVTETVPHGHKTRQEWQEEWGVGSCRAREILKRLVRSGIAGVRMFRVMSGQVVRPVPHYYEITNDTPAAQEPVRKSRKAHGKGCPPRRKGHPVRRRNT